MNDAIEVQGLCKRYGEALAVDDLTFTVRPGRVTGFLGPNGAGKSTTMRLILGLDAPDAGLATIAGRLYRDLRTPMRHVGALLEARALHPGRTAYDHLSYLAASQGIGIRRVDELLEVVGLAAVARRRVGGYSLGMGQRLGIAVALLADPGVVMLDEPINGLDVDGVRWVRELLRTLADEGRTVLLSSHLLAEISVTADHLIVIQQGRLVADCPTADLLAGQARSVLVVTPEPDRLTQVTRGEGAHCEAKGHHTLLVTGLTSARIGELAQQAGLTLHELSPQRASLEQAFVELTTTAGSAG
ncbi:MAG TPA: ATP-binding cassette domain-containing protein [Mycobacteriales bacterium]|nr:ATP-binding cassette domain-containing protein [Mycobacteriales bacterium]